MRKPKFRPEIRRVKLNPEQAVLACTCYNAGVKAFMGHHFCWGHGSYRTGCSAVGYGGKRTLSGMHYFSHSNTFGSSSMLHTFDGSVITS